jgi:hypothetical protein
VLALGKLFSHLALNYKATKSGFSETVQPFSTTLQGNLALVKLFSHLELHYKAT